MVTQQISFDKKQHFSAFYLLVAFTDNYRDLYTDVKMDSYTL